MTSLLIAFHSTALAGDAPPEWVHLIPAGTFVGRDGRGPYVLRDPQAVVAAFARGGTDLPIDYDHQLITKKQSGGRAPAAAWIKALEVRDDGIWGRVEWTAVATQSVQAKEYRFLSPVFRFDAKTGEVKELLHAGLVNDPNLALTAVASADHQGISMDEELLKRLRAILGLADGATGADIVACCERMATAGACHAADIKKIAGALKLAETADAAAIAVAAQSITTGAAEPDPAKYVPMSTFAALSSELAELRKTHSGSAAEVAVNSAMSEGKVSPAMKDWALHYAGKDPEGFAAWRAKAPVIVAPGVSAHATLTPPPRTDGPGFSAAERDVAAQLGFSEADWKKGA